MTAPEVNIPLLRKAVEWAEAEAAKPIELCEWEQGNWSAEPDERKEWARLIDKSSPVGKVAERLSSKASECGTCYCIAGYVAMVEMGRTVQGYQSERVARDALNLSDKDSAMLFDPDNTIADVRRIAESIAGERL